jgi:hypothetical protein
VGEDDPTTWQVALALGFGLLTYGSTASLRPAPRPLLIPPTTASRCDRCVSSAAEGASLSATRAIDGALRATVLVQSSVAPAFDDHVTIAEAGLGLGMWVPSSFFGGHVDVLVGAGFVRGPVDAISFTVGSLAGVDVRIARDAYVGLSLAYTQLIGAQPAGSGAISDYGVELRYRWR